MDFLSTLSSWCQAHGPMFAAVGLVGLLMAFAFPLFAGIMLASKERQEERIRMEARARTLYQKGGRA